MNVLVKDHCFSKDKEGMKSSLQIPLVILNIILICLLFGKPCFSWDFGSTVLDPNMHVTLSCRFD